MIESFNILNNGVINIRIELNFVFQIENLLTVM